MFNAIKDFIFGKPAPVNPQITDAVTQAPYKVPEPAATTPIPLVVESELPLVKLDQDTTVSVIIPVTDAALPVVAATLTAEVKKPRKPRTPKAVVETKVVKKAAPVKKAAAIKATPKTPRSKKV